MKTQVKAVVIAVALWLYAWEINAESLHKYWTCAVSSYTVYEAGKGVEHQCRANTEYSKPPCRPFVVEYNGKDGVNLDQPYQQEISLASGQPATARIEISKDSGKYVYAHTIEQTGSNALHRWHYKGVCQYNEAPTQEKIYMDYGLKAGR